MGIVENIQKLMGKNKLTRYKLAKEAGIPYTTLIKILDGTTKNPQIESLAPIAEYFKVSVDYLIGESVSYLIDEKLEEIGMTRAELAKRANVPLPFLQNLDNVVPDHEVDGGEQCYTYISSIAWVLGIPGSKLRIAFARQEIPADAYDGPRSSMEEDFADIDFEKIFPPMSEPSNVTPIPIPKNTIRIPVLGSIPAGMPVEAVQDIIGWEEIPEEWTHGERQYFGLKVKGDSMFPEYLEGDTVIIRKQPCCDPGDDCAVMVNDKEATLKRVQIYEDGMELEAVNPMYGKKFFTDEEVMNLPVNILGVVVELRRKKK